MSVAKRAPTMRPDVELDRVRRFRQAARLAVRTEDADYQRRLLALLDLVDLADDEPDPLVRHWSRLAVWEESRRFLEMDDQEPTAPSDDFERRQLALRRDGHERCPTCWSVLATDADAQRWRRMRLEHIEELERREKAIDG